MKRVLETALAHCGEISIMPIPSDGSKKPGLRTWKRLQSERMSAARLGDMYERHPYEGIAFITGQVSGHLECLDFDAHQAYIDFVEMCAAFGSPEIMDFFHSSYVERTPKGTHIFWRRESSSGNKKLARNPDGTTRIETRGEGGYVIVAPSCGGVHDTGEPYVATHNTPAEIKHVDEEMRDEVFRMCRLLDRGPQRSVVRDNPAPKTSATSELRPGDDFERRHDWHDVLVPHEWKPLYTSGVETYWRRPGKSKGVSATTNYDGSGLLYVFSSSTIFETNRGFSKFSAYAQLEHAGDFSAASSKLRADGYGSKLQEDVDLINMSGLEKQIARITKANQTEDDDDWKTMAELGLNPDDEPPPIEWLFKRGDEGVIPLKRVGMLVGPGGMGKTMMLIQAAVSIATGRNWIGDIKPALTGRVVLALAEEDMEEIRRRVFRTCQGLGLEERELRLVAENVIPLPFVGKSVSLVDTSGGKVTPSEMHQSMIEQLGKREHVCIILDPLSRFAPDVESNNAMATAAMTALELFGMAPGKPTIIVAHHTGKESRKGAGREASAARGVTGLTDGARFQMNLGGSDDDGLTLGFPKNNYGKPSSAIDLDRGPGGVFVAIESEEAELRRALKNGKAKGGTQNVRKVLLSAVRDSPGCNVSYLRECVSGVRAKTVSDVLRELVRDGELECLKSANNSKMFRISK